MDDLRRLRIADNLARPLAPASCSSGAPGFVGKVTTATPVVGKFLKVNPVVLTGAESEAGTGTQTVDTSSFVVVLALGPSAPATGDFIVCRYVDNRWVSDRTTDGGGGGGGGIIIDVTCDCDFPTTITMTVVSAGTPDNGEAQSATLTYGAIPPALKALCGVGGGLFDPGFYSTTSFTDHDGFQFWYELICHNNVASIVQWSFQGGSCVQATMYQYVIGSPNTCHPFSFTVGGVPGPGVPWTIHLTE